MRKGQIAAIAAGRDEATKQAFEVCTAAVQDLIGLNGPIRSDIPIGRLTTSELIWIVGAAIGTWVQCRAKQAALEGLDTERKIHTVGLTPDAWFSGVVESILSRLAEVCPDAPWSEPIGNWSKEEVVNLLSFAFRLIESAIEAAALVEEGKARPDAVDVMTSIRDVPF
jgi:hypothetical protein